MRPSDRVYFGSVAPARRVMRKVYFSKFLFTLRHEVDEVLKTHPAGATERFKPINQNVLL